MRKKYFVFVIFLIINIIPSSAQQNKIDSLLSLLKQKEKISDTSTVSILNALALEFRNEDPDTAIYFGNQALRLSRQLNDSTSIAISLAGIAATQIRGGDYDEALKNCNEALRIFDQLPGAKKTEDNTNILKQKSSVYNSIGNINWYQGTYTEALMFHSKAMDIRKKTGDTRGIAGSHNNIGLIYFDLGNIPEALKNYVAALKINEETGNKKWACNNYENIGNLYEEQGNYPEALKNHLAALKIREEIGDKYGMAGSYRGIGSVYNEQQNFDEALKNNFAALKIYQELDDKSSIAGTLNNIGLVYERLQDYPEAMKNYLASLKIREEIGDRQGASILYSNIGIVYRDLGNYPDALKNYFTSLEIAEEIGFKRVISGSCLFIGNIYIKQKKNSEAAVYLKKALLIAKEIGTLENVRDAYANLATLDSMQGNFNQAFEHFKMFIAVRDSMINEESSKKIVQSQMQYDFDKKEAATKADHDKKDILSDAKLKQQTLIKNTTLGGVGIAGIFVFLSVVAFNRRKKLAFEKTMSVVEMKALRSQMNPHFISNSLQSINNYILDNDKENASEYLSRFSKLIRLILENSRQQEITIEKDLFALDLFLELEQQRFNNKFDYKIEVSDDLNPENTLIPPLLLQPFVENAILHGIRSIKNGIIRVKVKKEDNMIRCTVEDNGIGREQSVIVESGEQKKRESLGMKITLERLAVINQLRKVKAAIKVFDLRNKDNKVEGLLVELMLPCENVF